MNLTEVLIEVCLTELGIIMYINFRILSHLILLRKQLEIIKQKYEQIKSNRQSKPTD